jgi:hypothetical protein
MEGRDIENPPLVGHSEPHENERNKSFFARYFGGLTQPGLFNRQRPHVPETSSHAEHQKNVSGGAEGDKSIPLVPTDGISTINDGTVGMVYLILNCTLSMIS